MSSSSKTNNKTRYPRQTFKTNKGFVPLHMKHKLEKLKEIQQSMHTLCDDSSSTTDTQPSGKLSSTNSCMVDLKDLQKETKENAKLTKTKSKYSSDSSSSPAEYVSKSKKRKVYKSIDRNVSQNISKFKKGNKSKLSDGSVVKKLQNRTKLLSLVVSKDNESDSDKQKISDKKHLKLNKHGNNTGNKTVVRNDIKKQKNKNQESECSESEVEICQKQTEKKEKKHVTSKPMQRNSVILNENEVVSSSSEEFENSKFSHINSSFTRKLFQIKDHVQSTKSNSTPTNQTEGKTEISKEKSLHFKSHVIKILNKFKEVCSEYELYMEHVKWKHFKKELKYQESAKNLILKSKNVINKLKMELDAQEKDLTNFYEKWNKNCNLQDTNLEYSSLSDNEILQTADSEEKSGSTKNKSSQDESLVSLCDSEEIFSANEKVSKEGAVDRNKETEVSLPVQASEKSVADNNKSMLSSKDNQVGSPILGSNKKKEISDKLNLKGKSNIVDVHKETSKKYQEHEDKRNINDSMQDIFEEITENVEARDILKQKENELESDDILKQKENKLEADDVLKQKENELESDDILKQKENKLEADDILKQKENELEKEDSSKSEKDIDEALTTDSNFNKGKNLLKFKELHVKLDNKHSDTNKVTESKPKSPFSQETLALNTDDNESVRTTESEKNASDELNGEEQAKKALLESDSETFPNEESLSEKSNEVSTESLKNTCTSQCEKIKYNEKDEVNKMENNSIHEDSSLDEQDAISDVEIFAKHVLFDSNSDDCPSPSYSKETSDKTCKSGVNSENIHAKATSLFSSNSESSNSDSDSNLQVTKVDSSLNDQKKEMEENSLQHENISHFDINVSETVKKQQTVSHKTYDLESDKKLKLHCHIIIEKLSEETLKKYADALYKSRQNLDAKEIKSLINLDRLKRDCKKTNISMRNCSSLKKTKTGKEVEDTLLDHLEKVENGEFIDNPAEDSGSESINPITETQSTLLTTEELMKEADMASKNILLNSSDSDVERNNTSENNNSEEEDKIKIKESPEKTKNKSSSSNENNEDEAVKNKWRRNKILTTRFSDSDSDVENAKWEKKQQKLREKAEESHTESSDCKNKIIKRKRRNRYKIMDSDADVELLNSDSNSVSSVVLEDQKSSDTDSTIGKEQKKTRKRKTRKSSDTDSSLAGKRPKVKRKRIKNMETDSDDSSNSDENINSQGTPGKKGRKNIRKVLKDKHIADDTKQAAKEEEERLKRIAERQKLYNEMYEARLAGEERVEKLVLDFNPETKEELVSVHKDLVKRLKPHQAKGIKFMWDACFESLERIKSSSGSGCIIAHCMGLGKTLQVIALIHTLLVHEKIGVNTVMVVCPLSTVLNWHNEFNLWLKDIDNGDIEIYELTKYKKNIERKSQLACWQRTGGVLIIGYELFRNLSGTNNKMRKSMKEEVLRCLIDPGPDVIVCDEGHLLKNEDSVLSKSIKRIKTLRRIILTGTPLQNNLIEYHCMVQFIKPNLLGTRKEFLNRFANPITNGQFDDSTESDVKLMKKRAYVLHKMLQGSVQRFDYSVLMPFLPPKQEYVIFVNLTDVQIKMYQFYLDNFARRLHSSGGSLFSDFQVLQRIWTHPVVLRLNAEKMEKLNEKKCTSSDSEGSLRDFIDDNSNSHSESSTSSTSDDDVQSIKSNDTSKNRRNTRNNNIDVDVVPKSEENEKKEEEWWSQFIQPEHFEDMRISAKLTLLFGILKECEQIGDKVLVFSQSLYSLTLIEQFLEKIDNETQQGSNSELIEGHRDSWSIGLDYFRLDGQSSAENRNRWCRIFNKPSNTRARLFLISTRAGGLGINLTAANRVIIFDASWNPSHDVQSIFRVYRFGQKKPCYIYRFLAAGTMEEKIYNRQVTKLSLSCRVVDEQQIERHYSNNDLSELYKFEPNTTGEKPTLNLPKDRLLAEIFLKYKNFVENYHEHDSLLENKAEEELDEEERKQAWLEYEEEKKGKPIPYMYPTMASISNNAFLNHYNLPTPVNLGADYENLQELIRKDYPNATPEYQQMMTTRVLADMYSYWEQQTFHNSSANQLSEQQNAAVMQTQMRTQLPNLVRMPYARNLNMNINGQTRDELPLTNKNNDAKSRGVDDDVVEITSPAVSKKNKTQEE